MAVDPVHRASGKLSEMISPRPRASTSVSTGFRMFWTAAGARK